MTASSLANVAPRISPRSTTIVLAILALAMVCALGVWVASRGGEPFAGDRAWHSLVGIAPGGAGYAIAATLADIGSALGVSLCVCGAAVLLLIKGKRMDAIAVAATAAMGVICSELLKILVARPRPIDALLEPPGFSYPSGHAMGAAALATGLALTFLACAKSGWTRLCVIVAASTWTVAMMWSRTALHVHWLSDTVAGALLGWGVAVLVRAAVHATGPTLRGLR